MNLRTVINAKIVTKKFTYRADALLAPVSRVLKPLTIADRGSVVDTASVTYRAAALILRWV